MKSSIEYSRCGNVKRTSRPSRLVAVAAIGPRCLLAGFMAVVFSCSALASTLTATATTDRQEVQVADPFKLSIQVVVAEMEPVRFPAVAEQLGAFHVISHSDIFDVPSEGGRLWKRQYVLEAYESGLLQIPPMRIQVGSETATTSPLEINVQSLLDESSDPTDFRGLKDVAEIPVEEAKKLSVLNLGLALGAVALLVILIIFLRWRRTRPMPPDAWALEQLDALLTTSHSSHDQTIVLPKAADILREFIVRQFQIAATRQTTDEFLNRIQTAPILDAEQQHELGGFLEHIDRIKFANLIPATDQIGESIERVRRFVVLSSERSDGDDSAQATVSETA